MAYQAPLQDLRFLLNELVDFPAAVSDPEMMTAELALTIWEEAGKFAAGVLEPLNATADRAGLQLQDGVVTTPAGFADAWAQLCANGWNNMALPEQFGGQQLPWMVSSLATEMFSSANKSFTMCPGLTQGAVEAIFAAASDELKQTYLPKMVAGEWTGTMNLTEPQAGSDVGALRTRAMPQTDGSYRIKGQKIFISFGEHDMAENIIHLVLARTPDAPAGVRGISLFLVPKFLVNDDGSLGPRNDLVCAALEHKLGIHASPTAVMSFGDNDGAVGYLVGEENKGLAAMFVMMNMARLAVGIEGVASAEAALQLARNYAFERVQGASLADPAKAVAIADHADVRRMLMLMQSRTRAMRALALVIAEAQDLNENHADPLVRQQQQKFIELMIPVFKAWATESGVEVASLGIQIHGGMGFVEETGAAQIWRDARISPIYEGTTGIQANDLIGRKLFRDKGESFGLLIEQMQATVAGLNAVGLAGLASRLQQAVERLADSGQRMIKGCGRDMALAQFVSVPFLMLFGHVAGGWLLCRCAIAARQQQGTGEYAERQLEDWLQSAEFYSRYTLAEVAGLQQQIENWLAPDASLPDMNLLAD
ncbi:acyl-CoA dehydrogenase [Oceanobacter mangrovi]|uniref:acyl-CoA dehydrogenase n=1 Tax=Oceanobacter mangrovi TaxID=2862510 RepID=UPI001C8CFBD9|nr:acyl-CoA dehydrogenase [Oceanobacter mangrovi]